MVNDVPEQWQITRFGEPLDVLERVSAPPSELEPGSVLVEVEAIGLNFLDVSVCRGDYGLYSEFPVVPGAELAGRVVAVGDEVERVAAGDRVAGMSPSARGGFATQVVLPEAAVHAVPATMPATDAAALLVTYQTSYFALVRRAALLADEWLLVHAGAGGVGTAAIQLARSVGARVVATAGTDEKLEVCRHYGAEVAIGHREDFVRAAMEATDGRGVDVVLDPIGGSVFERSLDCCAVEARVIPIGWASGVAPTLLAAEIVRRNLTVVGLSWGSAYPLRFPAFVAVAHEALVRAYESGAIRPHIPRVWGFGELPTAVQALADGETVGKVVVEVSPKQ